MAKRKGVALAAPAAAPALAPAVKSSGWLAKAMPAAADVMASLRLQLGPELWAEVMDNLRAGRGYVVDLSTGIAVGEPPPEWARGRTEERGGLAVMRVRRVE